MEKGKGSRGDRVAGEDGRRDAIYGVRGEETWGNDLIRPRCARPPFRGPAGPFSLKTVHWTVFRAFGPPTGEGSCGECWLPSPLGEGVCEADG